MILWRLPHWRNQPRAAVNCSQRARLKHQVALLLKLDSLLCRGLVRWVKDAEPEITQIPLPAQDQSHRRFGFTPINIGGLYTGPRAYMNASHWVPFLPRLS